MKMFQIDQILGVLVEDALIRGLICCKDLEIFIVFEDVFDEEFKFK